MSVQATTVGKVSPSQMQRGEDNTKRIITEKDLDVSFPWQRMDIILSTIGLNLFAVVIPVLILQLYDRIIPNQAISTLTLLAIGVSITVIFEGILRISRSYILGWIGQKFDYKASTGVFNHLMGANLFKLNRMGIGEHVENLESLVTLKEFLAGQGFLVMLDLPFLLFFLVLISYFGGKMLAVAACIILILFVLASLFVGSKLHDILLERQELGDRKYNFLIEILNNHYTVKSMGMEELFLRRFERINLQASYIEYKINMMSSEARDVGSTFSSILFGAIICVSGYNVIENQISPGAMAACLFLSNRLIQPLQMGLSMWTRFQHFKIAKQRFKNVFSLDLEKNHGQKKIIKGGLTLKNVNFSYEGAKRELLQNVNLHINAGEFVTIIGESGAGKTTLSQLMIGNIEHNSGQILIDGFSLHEMNMPHFRSQVAYLSPRGEIFRGTVMENLTFFSTYDNLDHAMTLSKKVGLDRWVSQLPLGYNTMIGNHLDSDIPLGIQQRICLVRALLLAPKILILDEANTSLDIEGDKDMLNLLKDLKGHMTIIFVTHRPSVARLSDRVFQLREKTISERPTE